MASVQVKHGRIYISGPLTERTVSESRAILRNAVEQARAHRSEGLVQVDFSEVTKVNIGAALDLVKTIRERATGIRFQRVTEAVIRGFNQTRGFFCENSTLESFYAPYASEDGDSEERRLFRFGHDFNADNWLDWVPPAFEVNGRIYEPDFDTEDYLAFIDTSGITTPKRPTVFVVDDDEDFCEVVKASIESHGFAVRTYIDAAKAMQDLASHMPDLLFVDQILNGIKGTDWIKSLQEKAFSTEVILCTGYGSRDLEKMADEMGVGFVAKPLSSHLVRRLMVEEG